jgi:nitrile hydratase accessory protein
MTAPLAITGPGAPPRSNGELVFAEPWESRAFGLAVGLYEAGVFAWPQFQAALIARIAVWESSPTQTWSYYQHWLGALEDVLSGEGALPTAEVDARVAVLASRPTGHDHRDGDEHHHHSHSHHHPD